MEPEHPQPSPSAVTTASGGRDPRQRVEAVSLVLLVVNGLGLALQLLGLIQRAVSDPTEMLPPTMSQDQRELVELFSGEMASAAGAFSILVGGFVIYGLLQMRQLQSYGMAMAAVVLGMVPCVGPCWCLALPLGIWGLLVLNDADVKAAFH